MNGTHTFTHSPTLIHYRDTIRKLHTNTVHWVVIRALTKFAIRVNVANFVQHFSLQINDSSLKDDCTGVGQGILKDFLYFLVPPLTTLIIISVSIPLGQQRITRPQILPRLQLDPAHSWLWRSTSSRNRIQRTSPPMYFLGLAGWVTVWRIYWRLHSDGTLAWTKATTSAETQLTIYGINITSAAAPPRCLCVWTRFQHAHGRTGGICILYTVLITLCVGLATTTTPTETDWLVWLTGCVLKPATSVY